MQKNYLFPGSDRGASEPGKNQGESRELNFSSRFQFRSVTYEDRRKAIKIGKKKNIEKNNFQYYEGIRLLRFF